MKGKFFKNNILSSFIELVTDETNENSWYARVEVYFFDLDNNDVIPKIRINVNARLSDLTPLQACEWGDILRASSVVAELNVLPWFSDSVVQAIVEAKRFFGDVASEN